MNAWRNEKNRKPQLKQINGQKSANNNIRVFRNAKGNETINCSLLELHVNSFDEGAEERRAGDNVGDFLGTSPAERALTSVGKTVGETNSSGPGIS